jgi:peptidoglycan/xylan/chitin deacetylase (PgdA/CDA1 family)
MFNDITRSRTKLFLIFILTSLLTIENAFCAQEPKVKVPILMYHHIRSIEKDDVKMLKDLSCSMDNFRDQLVYLKEQGYTTVTFWDLFEYFKDNGPLPSKPVILTFDDGYDDNWLAFKELQKNKMQGVFFIVVKTIGDAKHLSSTQLRTMSRDGMEIGSHTIDHVDLTRIKPEKAEKQVFQSKELLEVLLGRPVISFCYPEGKYNKKVVDILKNSTYWFARTTQPGISEISGKNYKLRTIRVHDYTTRAKLSQALAGD